MTEAKSDKLKKAVHDLETAYQKRQQSLEEYVI